MEDPQGEGGEGLAQPGPASSGIQDPESPSRIPNPHPRSKIPIQDPKSPPKISHSHSEFCIPNPKSPPAIPNPRLSSAILNPHPESLTPIQNPSSLSTIPDSHPPSQIPTPHPPRGPHPLPHPARCPFKSLSPTSAPPTRLPSGASHWLAVTSVGVTYPAVTQGGVAGGAGGGRRRWRRLRWLRRLRLLRPRGRGAASRCSPSWAAAATGPASGPPPCSSWREVRPRDAPPDPPAFTGGAAPAPSPGMLRWVPQHREGIAPLGVPRSAPAPPGSAPSPALFGFAPRNSRDFAPFPAPPPPGSAPSPPQPAGLPL